MVHFQTIQVQGSAAGSTGKGLSAGTFQDCVCVLDSEEPEQLLACPSAWVRFLFVGIFLVTFFSFSLDAKYTRCAERDSGFELEREVDEVSVARQRSLPCVCHSGCIRKSPAPKCGTSRAAAGHGGSGGELIDQTRPPTNLKASHSITTEWNMSFAPEI